MAPDDGIVYFRAVDNAGNETASTYKVISSDKTRPTIDFEVDNTEWTNDQVTLTATFSDDGSGIALKQYKYSLAGAWRTYTRPLVSKANSTIYLRAVDNAGNATTSTYKVTNIDKTGPAIDIVETALEGDDVELSATFTDEGSGIALAQYRFTQDGDWSAYTQPLVAPDDGIVYFRAVDNAGNETIREFDGSIDVIQTRTDNGDDGCEDDLLAFASNFDERHPTLVFDDDDQGRQDASTLTHADGDNASNPSGVAWEENLTLQFGNGSLVQYSDLLASDALGAFTNGSGLDDRTRGMLA